MIRSAAIGPLKWAIRGPRKMKSAHGEEMPSMARWRCAWRIFRLGGEGTCHGFRAWGRAIASPQFTAACRNVGAIGAVVRKRERRR